MSRARHSLFSAAYTRSIARSFICTLLASNALAYSGIQIQSPSRISSCIPYNITWTGGISPFTLNFVPFYLHEPDTGPLPILTLPVDTSFYLWLPNFPSAIGFGVNVSDGNSTASIFAWNDQLVVDGCTNITESSSSTTSSIQPTIATQPIFTISFPTSTIAPTPSPAIRTVYVSPTQPSSSPSSRQWTAGAAVAGGAVGVVFIVTVAAGFYFRRRRRRNSPIQENGVWAEWNEDEANSDHQNGRLSQVDSDESFGTEEPEQQGLIGSNNASSHSAPSGFATRIRGIGNSFLGSPLFGYSSISSSRGRDDTEAAREQPSSTRKSTRRGLNRTVLSDISEKTEPTETTSLTSSARSPPLESPQPVSASRLPHVVVSQEAVPNVAAPKTGPSTQDGGDSRTNSLQSTERSDTTASDAARDITGMLRSDDNTGLVGTPTSELGRTGDRNSTSTSSSPPHSSLPSPAHTLMSILDVPTPSTPDLDPNFPPISPTHDSPTHRSTTRHWVDSSSMIMSRVDSPLPLASSPDLDPDLRRSRSAVRKSSMQSFAALTDHMVSRGDTMSSTNSEVSSFGTRASSLVVDPDIHTTQLPSPTLTPLRPAGHRAPSPRQILRAKSKDKIKKALADVPESVTSSDGKDSPRLVESPVGSISETTSLRGEHPRPAGPGGSNDHV